MEPIVYRSVKSIERAERGEKGDKYHLTHSPPLYRTYVSMEGLGEEGEYIKSMGIAAPDFVARAAAAAASSASKKSKREKE